jgi:diguanylate cyclase (GGDEF)-like protein
MKIERKITFIQSLVYGCLVLSLLLSVAVIVLLFQNPSSSLSIQTVFWLISINIVLLFVVLFSVIFLFRKLFRKSAGEKTLIDELSGFVTRQDFIAKFEHILLDSSFSNVPLSLLMIDIDHFRRINDKYGHQAGDKVLAMLSKSVQSILRTSDISCRWAGDQFLVVLNDCAVQDACRIAAKVLVMVRKKNLRIGRKTIRVTTSIGVAQRVTDDTVKTLIARAETGLHSACDNGRNTSAIGYDWILLEYYSKPIF